jgi:hypothetical protein
LYSINSLRHARYANFEHIYSVYNDDKKRYAYLHRIEDQ